MEPISRCGFWSLTIVLFLCVISNGLVDTMRAVTYPLIRTDLNITLVQFGALESMGQFSYTSWALVTAIMMHLVGFKIPFVASYVISILGCLGTAFTRNYYIIMLFQFISACVTGALDDGPCSVAVILFTKNPATMFCIMSGMYGLGAWLGPLMSTFVRNWIPEHSYRGISFMMCFPLLLIGFIVFLIPFAIKRPTESEKTDDVVTDTNESEKKHISILKIFTSPIFWFCAIMLNMMATAERGTLSYGAIYVTEYLKMDFDAGANLNSRFYFIFMVSRFLGGFITDFVGPIRMEYIIIPLGIIVYIIGFALKATGIYVLPFVGLFASLFWPTCIIICTRYWKGNSAIPIACLIPMQSFVGVFVQYGLGHIGEKFGPQIAYYCSVPAAVIALVMLMIFKKILEQKEKREANALLVNEQKTI